MQCWLKEEEENYLPGIILERDMKKDPDHLFLGYLVVVK